MNLKLLNIIGVKDLVEAIGKTIDNIVTSGKEKETLRLEIMKIIYQLDITSDSWLSKNIRPLTLLIGWAMFILFSCLDGSVIEIKPVYVELMGKMLWTLTGFYFGLRETSKLLLNRKK